jgi:hypothetical protein
VRRGAGRSGLVKYVSDEERIGGVGGRGESDWRSLKLGPENVGFWRVPEC